MKNRQKLHDAGLVLIIFSFISLFSFVTSIIADMVNGSFFTQLEAAEPIVRTVTIVLISVTGALSLCMVFAQFFLGYKGLQISKNPTTAKGHITLAKVFFVLSIILTATLIATLIGDKNADIVNTIISLACAILDVIVYKMYINAANAVRQEAIKG